MIQYDRMMGLSQETIDPSIRAEAQRRLRLRLGERSELSTQVETHRGFPGAGESLM